jgi:phosphatidylinositol alpha-mannosyltransferase
MKPLKVAIYHATLPRSAGRKGGVEAAVHRLANSLTGRDDIDLTVYSSGTAPDDARYAHVSILNQSNKRQLTRLLLSPFLLNFQRFGKADVVHLHGDDWFLFRRPFATVRTMHGSALHEARTASTLKRRLMQRLVFRLEKLATRLATLTIANGRETEELYGTDTTIGMSVDRDTYLPAPKTDHPSVFFVGGWSERKRGSFMYDTFINTVLPHVPDARLYMVTDVEHPHPSVTFLKNLTDAELAHHLARSWVFAYPSLYEGFGIAYIEAMACGTPVVTTPNAGAADVLADGRYGSIVDDGRFGHEIVAVLRDPEQRAAMAEQGRKRAACYDERAIADQNISVYRQAVQQ